MNDFTKEELSEIRGILIAYGVQGEDLELKIKTMIDDYCEHEKLNFMGDTYGYDCKKCGKEFTGQNIDEDRRSRIINCEE